VHKNLCSLHSLENRAICRVTEHMTGRRFALIRRLESQRYLSKPALRNLGSRDRKHVY
jgi:hypothetical protein